MIFDTEPKNSKIKDMEEVELDDAVEVTKNSNRLKKMFNQKMKDEDEEPEDEDDKKASKLSDFIEVVIRLKK
ncbi:MAG: hypothetical protein DRN30_04535 [Thermoplasmata archaeon]|nr:MAG: hypothetical protein DRN30_04535 [Thermoplasmata archaeon]